MSTADDKRLQDQECTCPYTDPSTWLSAASCGYGSGYEPGSMQEWNPDCPVHPADDTPPDTRSEVEALARVICAHSHAADPKRLEGYCPLSLEEAEWLLTSPWLAQHDAQVAAKTKAEVVQYLVKSIERRREQHAPTALQDVVYRTVLRIVRGESPNEPQA